MRATWKRLLTATLATLLAVGAVPALGGAAAATTPVPPTSLTLAVSHTPAAPKGGDPLTLTAVVTNHGPNDAPNVAVLMQLQVPIRVTSMDLSPVAADAGSCSQPVYRADLVICTLSSLPNGQQITITVTGNVYDAPGISTIQVGVASDAADPTPANRLATDTILVLQGPTFGQRLATGLYQKLLGRTPSKDELAYWSGRIDRSQPPGANPAWDIISSAEYRRIEVGIEFNRVLGHAPDAAALSFWSTWLAGRPFDDLTLALVGTTEFNRIPRPAPGGVVIPIYHLYVGHNPDAAGAAYWNGRIARGASPIVLARALATSRERIDQLTDRLFQDVLNHAPNTYDRWVWRSELGLKHLPWEHAWANLLNSFDYTNQFSVPNGCCVPLPVQG